MENGRHELGDFYRTRIEEKGERDFPNVVFGVKYE